MILTSFLLAAVTFSPAITPATPSHHMTEGTIEARAISPDATCAPGHICASTTLTGGFNGCFFHNFYNGKVGGTPLTLNVTDTGSNGAAVYLYWVNATTKTITILSHAKADYVCLY
jgi:hypothetical protein